MVRDVKHLLHLKPAVLALVLTSMFLGKAHAAWSPATLEQIGVYYYYYLTYSYASTLTPQLPAGSAAAAVQGFGPNVVGFAVNTAESQNQSMPLEYLGGALLYYYGYLGFLLGYQNYLNPAYAEQLENYYTSYGSQVQSYYQSLASFYLSYYAGNATYYSNLIF